MASGAPGCSIGACCRPARSGRLAVMGAFFTPQNRADAAANGVIDNAPGDPYLANQPVQGFSAMVPAGDDTWWTLTDNGFGARENSADYQLAVYRIDPHFGQSAPEVRSATVLRDPDHHVPWKIVCDQTGAPLPDLSINVLPATPPPACGSDPAARILTGFDFDPESLQVGADGTFWIGDEFGPFLLHADATGKLLEAPIATPGIKAPQNPTLDVATAKSRTWRPAAASRAWRSARTGGRCTRCSKGPSAVTTRRTC